MTTKSKNDGRRFDEADAEPDDHLDNQLTWVEHIDLAKQIYALGDALHSFTERYRKTHCSYNRVASVARCLDQLRSELDSALKAQFPENPRPADPDFMDSPYYSAAIQNEARAEQPIKDL